VIGHARRGNHQDGAIVPPNFPPKPPSTGSLGNDDGGGPLEVNPASHNLWYTPPKNASTVLKIGQPSTYAWLARGGGSASVKSSPQKLAKTTSNYWKGVWKSTTTTLSKPFVSLKQATSDVFKSKKQRDDEAIMAKLQTMPVRAVRVANNATVLPDDVVQMAATRAGLIGQPLRTDRVQAFARNLKHWYARQGYVLHSVTGATIDADSAVAEISVEEPCISAAPVDIVFCKEMVVDNETGQVLTFRQYREKHSTRRTFGFDKIKRENLNTTFVAAPGRTNPNVVAKALRLLPGRSFQWEPRRWQQVAGSGIFSRVLRASPERLKDGSVQLQILCQEAAPRHLEYGLTKSLYTGSWEGEIDFEHANLLGGGERLGLLVRRGTRDAEPSLRVHFTNDKFGMEGGYNVQVFSDYIGASQPDDKKDANKKEQEKSETDNVGSDDLLDRRGASFQLRNPIHPQYIEHSTASACVERTSTKSGHYESIGSATLSVGPFRKELPLDARSDIVATCTTGTRIAERSSIISSPSVSESEETTKRWTLLPYSSVTTTTRQVFPLNIMTTSSSNARPPFLLALQHSLTTSSRNLPRHEANVLGNSATIRGGSPNGPVVASLVGTTEIRVPVLLPTNLVRQDASLVLFGDWVFARKDWQSPFFRKSSIGVGLRKSIQGIPLKCDVSYNNEGKVRTAFGLGRDFEV
jgi:outer membrane protein assembly factor BamA